MIRVYSDIEQGTPEWFAVRAGIPTASEFDAVCAKVGPRGGQPVGRRKYMMRLIGERMTGEVEASFSNFHMERGKRMEPDARELYAYETGNEVQQVGFVRHEGFSAGCSPDSLIGEEGALEIKTKLPSIMCEVLLSQEIPAEHVYQLQGTLWITGRQWIDFVAYWPNMPVFIKRAYRDEAKIAEIADGVAKFNSELEELLAKLRAIK